MSNKISLIRDRLLSLETIYEEGYVERSKLLVNSIDPDEKLSFKTKFLNNVPVYPIKVNVSGFSKQEAASSWEDAFPNITAEFFSNIEAKCLLSIRINDSDGKACEPFLKKVADGYQLEIIVSEIDGLSRVDGKQLAELLDVVSALIQLHGVLADDGYSFSDEDRTLIRDAKSIFDTRLTQSERVDGTRQSEAAEHSDKGKVNESEVEAYEQYCASYKELQAKLLVEIDVKTKIYFDSDFVNGCSVHQPVFERANPLLGDFCNVSHASLCHLLDAATSEKISPARYAYSASLDRDFDEIFFNVDKKNINGIRIDSIEQAEAAVLNVKQHGYSYLPEKDVFQVLAQVFMKARRHIMLAGIVLGILGLQSLALLAKGSFIFMLFLVLAMSFALIHQRNLDAHIRLKRSLEAESSWKQSVEKFVGQIQGIRLKELKALDVLFAESRLSLDELRVQARDEALPLRGQWELAAEARESIEKNEKMSIDKQQLERSSSHYKQREIFRQSTSRVLRPSIRRQQSLVRKELSSIAASLRVYLKGINWGC